MARNKKYQTLEEKKAAGNETAKRWYHQHKNDPEFILRRKWYQAKYYDKLNVEKHTFMREYNTDYAFYIRSIRTGKLENKIQKAKEQYNKLKTNIENMEKRLVDLKQKFGHLDNKTHNKEEK